MAERNKKGQFASGHTPIKGAGRPAGKKSISGYIYEKTNNLHDLVDLAHKLLYKKDTKTSDKIILLNMLFDRSIGRPQALIHQTGDLEIVIGKLSDED